MPDPITDAELIAQARAALKEAMVPAAYTKRDWWVRDYGARLLDALEAAQPREGDDDAWRKPPPHFKADKRWQRQPQSDIEWDRHADTDHQFQAKRRLAFASDLADPRAPKGMALVSRWDISTILSRLTWLEARFENTKDSALPPPPEGELRTLIQQCAEWFEEYGDGHNMKTPPDTEKAKRNYERASICRAALGSPS